MSGDESLPGWLPIELTDQGRIDASARLVYRSFGPRLLGEASFVDISGSVDLGGSFLTGVRLTGRTTTQLLPLVGVGSELTLDAFISPVNLGASFVDLRGTIGVADAPLGADALIRLDGTGIRAGGVVELSPNNRVGVEEAITSREVSLSGDLTLSVRTGEIFGFLDGVGGAAGDARAEIARLERLAQVGIAEGAEAIDGILSFDARVQADLSVTIGTDGISGRVTGSVCNGDGCLELVGGSVTFAPTPEACFSAGPATGCLRL